MQPPYGHLEIEADAPDHDAQRECDAPSNQPCPVCGRPRSKPPTQEKP